MLFGRHNPPIKLLDKGVVKWSYTTCGCCSTGCSIEVGVDKSGADGVRLDTAAGFERGVSGKN